MGACWRARARGAERRGRGADTKAPPSVSDGGAAGARTPALEVRIGGLEAGRPDRVQVDAGCGRRATRCRLRVTVVVSLSYDRQARHHRRNCYQTDAEGANKLLLAEDAIYRVKGRVSAGSMPYMSICSLPAKGCVNGASTLADGAPRIHFRAPV